MVIEPILSVLQPYKLVILKGVVVIYCVFCLLIKALKALDTFGTHNNCKHTNLLGN